MPNLPFALGVLDPSNTEQIAAMKRKCHEEMAINMQKAVFSCNDISGYVNTVSGGVSSFDNREFNSDF